MSKPTVAITTLGCKVNRHESDAVLTLFEKHGYQEVPFDDVADIYVINTCTVTHLADRKSRQMIRRAVQTNPEAVIAVMGCYAQTTPGEVMDIPGVHLVIGTRDRNRIVELVEEYKGHRRAVNAVTNIMEASEFEEIGREEPKPHRARAYLKIQEGCSQFCSYCIIPYARGPVRSRPLHSTIQAAENLVASGYKEIILTGIHTGAYGMEKGPEENLVYLVEHLIKLPGLKRLRISSIDPHEVGKDLIDLMKTSPVLCRHLHIPLQSGDDHVLKRMKRVYSTQDYAKLVSEIRTQIPEIALTTDIMVGFPGETDEEFTNTLRFTEKMAFSMLHVFKYSPRKGTPAADYPNQITPEVKEARSKELISLGRRLSKNYAEKFINRTLDVLFEQKTVVNQRPHWEGHTDNYLTVSTEADGDLRGQILPVRLEKYQGGIITGQVQLKD